MTKICAIDGCQKRRTHRDWCGAHYYRWRAHGDPLGGRTPVGEPMAFFQNVVLPYDGDECLTWPYADDGKGYGVLWIDKALAYVHRLTCQEQNGPAPSPEHEAAHECGKGHLGCVTKRHMAWKTHADNMDDKFIHGTVQRGEEVGTAKLQLEQVRQIKRKTMRAEDAAEKFGVSIATVYSIRRGENWGWVNV